MSATSSSGKTRLEPESDVDVRDIAVTFVRFKDLEKKVRLRIWELALPGPRVVFVEQQFGNMKLDIGPVVLNKHGDQESDQNTHMDGDNKQNLEGKKVTDLDDEASSTDKIFKSQKPAPAIIFVCRESRSLALESYSTIFAKGNSFPGIWFNFQLDTLLLDYEWRDGLPFRYPPQNLCKQDCQRVENLAVLDNPSFQKSAAKWLGGVLSDFQKVKKLSIVNWHFKPTDRSEIVLIDIIDVDAHLSFYSSDFDDARESDFFHQQPEVSPSKYVQVSQKLLKKHMTNFTAEELFWWEMPEIRRKTATSSDMKEKLEKVMHRYFTLRWDTRRWPTTNAEHQGPSFSLFKRLPKDIRLLIWEAALPGPRAVHVMPWPLHSTCFGEDRVRSDEEVDTRTKFRKLKPLWDTVQGASTIEDAPSRRVCWGFRSIMSPPTVLFVCRESHELASMSYTRAFGSLGSIPQVWFDFRRDTLYLTSPIKDGCIPKDEKRKVERIAFGLSRSYLLSMHPTYTVYTLLTLIFAYFGNLKHFTLVVPDYAQNDVPWADLAILETIKAQWDKNQAALERHGVWALPKIEEQAFSSEDGARFSRHAERGNTRPFLKSFKDWQLTNIVRSAYRLPLVPETVPGLNRAVWESSCDR